MAKSYTITATPKVLERVYYAIERCRARPDASAQAVNHEIETRFGAPLSTQIWTIINAARKDDALSRITTRAFDFTKHGRVARTGKGKYQRMMKDSGHRKAGPPPAEVLQRLRLNPRKHPRYLVALWREKGREYTGCRTRKQAARQVRKMLRDGVAMSDIAVYQAEGLAIRLSL